MVFIIIPAVIGALGLGVAALAAREERREKEEQRQEKPRQAQEAAQNETNHRWRVDGAKRFITKHGLRITPELLMELASGREADLMEVMESQSRFTGELQEKRDSVRELESKMMEVTDLITVVERRRV